MKRGKKEPDDEFEHRVRTLAAFYRSGRKPPFGPTPEEHKAAMKLLEELQA